MNSVLIIFFSIISIMVIYWIIRGQKKYNDTFRDYFQPKQAEPTTSSVVTLDKGNASSDLTDSFDLTDEKKPAVATAAKANNPDLGEGTDIKAVSEKPVYKKRSPKKKAKASAKSKKKR